MSKTRLRYEKRHGAVQAAHRMSWRERLAAKFWRWAERYCGE